MNLVAYPLPVPPPQAGEGSAPTARHHYASSTNEHALAPSPAAQTLPRAGAFWSDASEHARDRGASARGQIGDEVVHAVGESLEHGKVQPIDRDENADPACRRQHHVSHKAGDAPALGQDQRAMPTGE